MGPIFFYQVLNPVTENWPPQRVTILWAPTDTQNATSMDTISDIIEFAQQFSHIFIKLITLPQICKFLGKLMVIYFAQGTNDI